MSDFHLEGCTHTHTHTHTRTHIHTPTHKSFVDEFGRQTIPSGLSL